uniref:Cystatin domain-containing protein n=1 Tax=Trichuris muris TaxID=70415 RepID=A0A5S6QKI2_TRIMR
MVATLPLALSALLLASVSAVSQEEVNTYVQHALGIINEDEESGPYLYKLVQHSPAHESGDHVTLTLYAGQTDCLKSEKDSVDSSCSVTGNSKVLQHNVTVKRNGKNSYTISTTGAMEPDSDETVQSLGLSPSTIP